MDIPSRGDPRRWLARRASEGEFQVHPANSSCSLARPEFRGRVAPAGFPTGALAGSGQGDFHHPALPDQTAYGGNPQIRTRI
jgi:hypothetical protein